MKKCLVLGCLGCMLLICYRGNAQLKLAPDWQYAVKAAFDLQHAQRIETSSPAYFLVQLRQGGKLKTLAQAGLVPIRKAKGSYAIVQASAAALQAHAHLLESAWYVNDLWKLSGNLMADTDQNSFKYTIKSDDPEKTLHVISGMTGLNGLHIRGAYLQFSCSYETLIHKIVPLPEVVYAGKEAENPVPDSRVRDMNLSANGINQIHHAYPELNGGGITLSIQENGFDPADIDLQGRERPSSLRAASMSNHATDMATIAAGAGNSFVTGKGVAWAASLTSSDFEDVLPDADEAYRELGVWVQNHSYGTVIESFYGVQAEAFDRSASNNPTLLHVISSGNQGIEAGTGTYADLVGWANLSGNFKGAKNILTIGAVDTLGRPMEFSSRGPAHDGRVKPELVAYSTAGSSNATALVSGLVVLLQQAYQVEHGNFPASALLKALLINSADDAGPKGLDFQTGYGNVNGFKALKSLKAGHYFTGSLSQGTSRDFVLELPAQAKNLKVSLVWTDPAAEPGSGIALVNDLDLRLTDSSGKNWLPWLLDAQANEVSLTKEAVRGDDHLNNIEHISLENPAAGTYSISVSGFDVLQGPQDFYIAYEWEEDNDFSWTFPTGSDHLPYDGETATYFRWESSLPATSGKLEYSLDGGASWELIQDGLDLGKEAYRWEVPQQSGAALARMTVGGMSYTTETFALARPLFANVGFNCADSILIQWNQLAAAQGYQVFMLGEQYMEPIGFTSDTLLVLKKQDMSNAYFSVQPVLTNGLAAIRSETFDYRLQGNSCYFSSFFTTLSPQQELFLHLDLGTTYQVEEIIFERKEDEQWVPIGSRPAGKSSSIEWQDPAPQQGLNVYRAKLRMYGGGILLSDEDSNYYLQNPPFVVFPNPASSKEGLQIVSKAMEQSLVQFKLYSQTGQLLRERTFTSDRSFLPLVGLQAGLYLYVIEMEGNAYHGKIILQ